MKSMHLVHYPPAAVMCDIHDSHVKSNQVDMNYNGTKQYQQLLSANVNQPDMAPDYSEGRSASRCMQLRITYTWLPLTLSVSDTQLPVIRNQVRMIGSYSKTMQL
jgi:hypothetical protein